MSKTKNTPAKPEGATGAHTPEAASKIKLGLYEVPLEFIRSSPTNPRKRFHEQHLTELAESIRVQGLVSPITVRPVGGTPEEPQFEIVAGERRWRACKIACLSHVPCVVRELTDIEVIELQIVENDQRVDVSPIEKARAISQLNTLGTTWSEIARKLGKTERHVREFAKLVHVPQRIQEALESGDIPLALAVEISKVPSDKLRDELCEEVFRFPESPMTTKELKTLIREKYQINLQTAAFDTKSRQLLPQAGSCTDCPKRAFNLAYEDPSYESVRPDTCTDPYCHAAKMRANLTLQEQKARKAGDTVFDDKQSRRALNDFPNLDCSTELFDLERPIPSRNVNIERIKTECRTTKLRLLLSGAEFKRTLLHTERLEPIWAIEQDEAMRLLVELGYAEPVEEEAKPAAKEESDDEDPAVNTEKPAPFRVVGEDYETQLGTKPSSRSLADAERILREISDKERSTASVIVIGNVDAAALILSLELDRVWQEATEQARNKP